jgi:hypothetical protein
MAEILLLPPLQLLRRYGHLHCLAMATGPAPPLAARRPGSDHASDACKARLLQEQTQKEASLEKKKIDPIQSKQEAKPSWLRVLHCNHLVATDD